MNSVFQADTLCTLCLRVNAKVYKINNAHHLAFIENICKLKGFELVASNKSYEVCYICMALLTKTYNFVQTIWNAQELICDLLQQNDLDKEPILEDIDRDKKGLNPINLTGFVIFEKVSEYPISKSEIIRYCTIELSDSCTDEDAAPSSITMELEDETSEHNKNSRYVDESNGFSSLLKERKRKQKNFEYDENNTNVDETNKVPLIITERKRPKNFKESSDSDAVPTTKYRRRKKQVDDIEYEPDSTSHSEDSADTFDDEGKKINRPDREYPRKCDHCDYVVERKKYHYHHYLFMHPHLKYPYGADKIYACSICGKLMSKQLIKRHELNHVDQKIKCTFCSKTYANRVRLTNHILLVHKNRDYICDYCSKKFKRRHDLVRHLRIHTGDKPFRCHICGEGFAHSGNRLVHIRAKHQNFRHVPKKRQQAQKVRRNKRKKDYSDTEVSSDEDMLPKKRKTTKKLRKGRNKKKDKKVASAETEIEVQNRNNNSQNALNCIGDNNIETNEHNQQYDKVCTDILEDIEEESEDENLAEIKRKKSLA